MQRPGDRLRTDPAIPNARDLDRAQLEDHIGTFLLRVGKSLITLDGRGEPALMRDDSEIQRIIAELHGEKRFRLEWAVDEMRRETMTVMGDSELARASTAVPPPPWFRLGPGGR